MIRIVHIKWRDAAAVTGWQNKKRLKAIVKSDLEACSTVGILVSENKKKVVIVHTQGTNEVSGVFEIPRGCIEKIETVARINER